MATRLVVVRHAKSDYPWGVDDHDRPLAERGRRDAPEVGAWLDAHLDAPGKVPTAVRVSTARRAQLTWAGARTRLSAAWDAADVRDEARIYEADVPSLLDVVAEAADGNEVVVLVGHNPGLAELVAFLGADDALRREALAKFPTSAIAVLDGEIGASAPPQSMRVSAFAVPRG